MQTAHLALLVCPTCKMPLNLRDPREPEPGRVESGLLWCEVCKFAYPIVHFIPRFVSCDNYAKSFGFEWKAHARTQYDSVSGRSISEERFFAETGWPRHLTGELILEAGSGSGRFTEYAAETGATVVSFDYSEAVEANHASNGDRNNVLIVQANIYHMPFREAMFDRVLCIGVLQHTPQVRDAFMALIPCLKPGGNLVIDVYARRSGLLGTLSHLRKTRYWVRPFTRQMRPDKLYRCCRMYINAMWPLARLIGRIPRIGHRLNWFLLIPDYRAQYLLPDNALKEWALLDLFDILSPTYDQPQAIETVRQWFDDAGMDAVDVHYGYNGIEGRGTKPAM